MDERPSMSSEALRWGSASARPELSLSGLSSSLAHSHIVISRLVTPCDVTTDQYRNTTTSISSFAANTEIIKKIMIQSVPILDYQAMTRRLTAFSLAVVYHVASTKTASLMR
jgi:hypothetical protein